MTRRFGSLERARRTLLTLPQALYHASHDYPGGATAIAAVDGNINPTTLNHKLSLTSTNPKHKPNIDELQLILNVSRDPRIVDALLAPIGWVGIDASGLRDTDTPKALLASLSELLSREGDMTKHLGQSLDDDKVTDDELAEFELLTERLVQAAFRLSAAMRKKYMEDNA
ncbi:hypothetical protein D9M68_413930 [compost metagenome]